MEKVMVGFLTVNRQKVKVGSLATQNSFVSLTLFLCGWLLNRKEAKSKVWKLNHTQFIRAINTWLFMIGKLFDRKTTDDERLVKVVTNNAENSSPTMES